MTSPASLCGPKTVGNEASIAGKGGDYHGKSYCPARAETRGTTPVMGGRGLSARQMRQPCQWRSPSGNERLYGTGVPTTVRRLSLPRQRYENTPDSRT
jgi:hypothetical protein